MLGTWSLMTALAIALDPPSSSASLGNLTLDRYSTVADGNLLPTFLFMQGESDGLEQAMSIKIGGGRGNKIPFVPDDSCDDAIFDGTSPDLRSPALPYLRYDTWGCERKPAVLPAILLDSPSLRLTIMPQYGGKVWSMYDKVAKREFFFSNPAHQPANIGARGAWAAGGNGPMWSNSGPSAVPTGPLAGSKGPHLAPVSLRPRVQLESRLSRSLGLHRRACVRGPAAHVERGRRASLRDGPLQVHRMAG